MISPDLPVAALMKHAAQAAEALKLLANEQRLMVLCRLSQGESSVGELVALTALSQSSVSQHLARLRESNIVATRRDGTTIYYRLADDCVHALIDALCDSFGPKPRTGG